METERIAIDQAHDAANLETIGWEKHDWSAAGDARRELPDQPGWREYEATLCPECHSQKCADAAACRRSGELTYFAEMGYREDDILSYRQRHAQDAESEAYGAYAARFANHENGGPADYPASERGLEGC